MILPLLLALQITPVAPLPKGTALPPVASDEGQVMAPVQRLFDAIAAHDPAAVLAEVRPDGKATAVVQKPDGAAVVASDWPGFAAKIGKPGPKLFERFTETPAIEIDGDIAMVWGSYTLTVDGKVSHCGTNLVDLVRDGSRWRINNITWTQRTSGCA